MITQVLQVGAFMRKFKQDMSTSPVDEVSLETMILRRHLSVEEGKELYDEALSHGTPGILKVDKVLALDALADRLYVLLGDAHSLGMGYLLPVAFRMVHESNMSKLWTVEEIAGPLMEDSYTAELVAEGTDRPYLVKAWTGKVVKSPSYNPAPIGDLFDDLAGQNYFDYKSASRLFFGDQPEPDIDEED
jgi:hypothetical protein